MKRKSRITLLLGMIWVFLAGSCFLLNPPQQLAVNISILGEGTVSKFPDWTLYDYGTEVELTAEPEGSWRFDRWEGDIISESNPQELIIVENIEITAVFVEIGVDENSVTSINENLTANGLDMQVILIIPAGTTDTYNTNTLTSYALSETEVTQGDYEAVIGSNPSGSYGVATDYPVYYVSWFDAVRFCNALSTLCGLEGVYDTENGDADFTNSGFYLPTEVQRVYAAGGPAHYTWSQADIFDTWDYACSVSPQDLDSCVAVKTHAANGFGLYGMSGNVWEWCHDWHDSSYENIGGTDPTGPSSGSWRVYCGGGWNTFVDSDALRCDSRYYYGPYGTYFNIGFRVAIGGFGRW